MLAIPSPIRLLRKSFSVLALLPQWLLWLSIPLYLGYVFWHVFLPPPQVIYQPAVEEKRDIVRLIRGTGWLMSAPEKIQEPIAVVAEPAPAPEPTIKVNNSIKLQGVFMRKEKPSIAIIAHSGVTEIAIEKQKTKKGYVVESVYPTEIQIKEPNGQRSIVRMSPGKSLNALYKQTRSSAEEVFVPNGALKLRPIGGKKKVDADASKQMYLQNFPKSYPDAERLIDSEQQDFPQTNPNPQSFETPLTGDNLPIEIMQVLHENPRFFQLSLEKQSQLRNLMAAPQFSEAVRYDPDVLDRLIDSFPVDVQY